MPEEIGTQPEEIIEEQSKVDLIEKLKIHKWKILTGILGVLILVGAVFGAYKLGQRQVQPGTAGPTPTLVAEATPTPDPTANWKTINGNGYQFKMPSDWEKKAPYNNQAHVFIVQSGEIEMWSQKKNANQSLEQWFSNDLATAPGYDKTSYTISTQNGHKILSNIKPGQQAMYAIEINDQSVLHITCGVGCDSSKFSTLFKPILETFKFLESKVGEKIECTSPRPEVCTMECIVNPPYICGSDGKSYCSSCQACSNQQVEWHVTQSDPCKIQ